MTTKKPWGALEEYSSANALVRNIERSVKKITESYRCAHPQGAAPSSSDLESWQESLFELATFLVDAGLGQTSLFVEYRVDPGMNPIDVVIAGRHPSGNLSFAAIELKQWGSIHRPNLATPKGLCGVCQDPEANRLCGDCATGMVFAPFYGKHKKHPAVQVHDSLIALRRHHSMFDDRYINIVGASYLHNLKDEDSQWISQVAPHPEIPTFTARQPDDLQKFLAANFAPGLGTEAAQALLKGRRSTALLTDDAGSIINGYSQFSLLENQLRAVNDIMGAVRGGPSAGAKRVFVISGRAGTGKSLVALDVLGRALRGGHQARFVSGGIASRDNFKRATRGHGRMFPTINQIADSVTADELDLIVCDEAHRLTHRPMQGSRKERPGETTVAAIVNRAKVPVFFIDGDQRIFPKEVWSPDVLRTEIQSLGAEVVPITLDRVLRAVGSATYDRWIQQFLAGAPIPWDAGDDQDPEPFKLSYAENATAMEDFLREKNASGASARISAGMCWKWDDRSGTVPEVAPDETWARPWNAGDGRVPPGVPKRKFWATGEGGFNQVGCIHTAQGLEYEWGGVIIGPDLSWDNGKWEVHRAHVRSKARQIKQDADLLRSVRNAYGVLLSRSIRGTVIYSVDPATRKLLADLGVPKV
ncbi:DNA/RNA helicase domain-containing protein [Kitasatospora sp. NPDC004531]